MAARGASEAGPRTRSWLPSVSTGCWKAGLGSVVTGPGSGLSEEPVLGCEPVALETESLLGALPGPSPCSC